MNPAIRQMESTCAERAFSALPRNPSVHPDNKAAVNERALRSTKRQRLMERYQSNVVLGQIATNVSGWWLRLAASFRNGELGLIAAHRYRERLGPLWAVRLVGTEPTIPLQIEARHQSVGDTYPAWRSRMHQGGRYQTICSPEGARV